MLPANPTETPRYRLRGKRRYFARVMRKARAFKLGLDGEPWWNYWHYHADWPGWGNLGWRHRREHLRALAVVFRSIVDVAPAIPLPFQLWLSLDVDDAGQDAVFMHSPNHHSRFPFAPAIEQWDAAPALTAALTDLFGLPLRVGCSRWIDDDGQRTTYLAYAPGVGVPLA